jgi:hypothetical protein
LATYPCFYDIGNTGSRPSRAAKKGMPVNTMGGVGKWAKPPGFEAGVKNAKGGLFEYETF